VSIKKNGEPRMRSDRWSFEEDKRFIDALKVLGKNWKSVAKKVVSKNE
jgi:hypothetical protein